MLVNTHDQLVAAKEAGLPDVAVCKHYWRGTRKTYRGGWHVLRLGKNLNPQQTNPWADDANVKVFGATAYREQRPALLLEAQAWAAQRYGITEWKRNRFGDYVDVRVDKQFPLEKR